MAQTDFLVLNYSYVPEIRRHTGHDVSSLLHVAGPSLLIFCSSVHDRNRPEVFSFLTLLVLFRYQGYTRLIKSVGGNSFFSPFCGIFCVSLKLYILSLFVRTRL